MPLTEITDLVLVPGLLCTADLYADQVADLAGLARTTVARHSAHPSVAAIAADILATAPPRFALAGLSMGGYVAFEILRQAPDRVDRLALLDTGPRPDTPERTEGRRKLIALGRQYGLAAVQKQLLPNLIHKARLSDAPLVERVVKMAVDTGMEGFLNQQEALISRPDCRPLLASIRCPTLIVVGAEDILTPPELAHEMHTGIPGSRLVTIPDCGHLSTMERPEAVTGALRAWLTDGTAT
jgi:pimeloyl-ACP methyl ester carboxylesterase